MRRRAGKGAGVQVPGDGGGQAADQHRGHAGPGDDPRVTGGIGDAGCGRHQLIGTTLPATLHVAEAESSTEGALTLAEASPATATESPPTSTVEVPRILTAP